MGTLKPNTEYIYERADGVTYAREFGSTERVAIGWEYKAIADNYWNSRLWADVLKEAETNTALQTALDRAIMIYRLSKDDPV
jgi:hypothetical protein